MSVHAPHVCMACHACFVLLCKGMSLCRAEAPHGFAYRPSETALAQCRPEARKCPANEQEEE